MAINYTGVNPGTGWVNAPSTATPRNAANLNIMNTGIKAACNGVDALNDNLVEEVVAISYASGVHGFCLKNKVTRKISLWVSIISPQNNPTAIATLPAGLAPTGGATIRSLAKQSSGIGECQLSIQSDGQVILSAIDYNEPMGGVIFNLFWVF